MLILRQAGGFISTTTIHSASLFSTANDTITGTGDAQHCEYHGRQLSLGDATCVVNLAPGGTATWTYLATRAVSTGVTQNSPGSVVIPAAGVSGAANLGFLIPPSASGDSAAGNNRYVQIQPANTPALPANFAICQEYDDASDGTIVYFAAGDGSAQKGPVLNTNVFLGVFRSGSAANSTSQTEANVQNVVGANGTIMYMFGRFAITPGTVETYEFALRKNGVDQGTPTILNGQTGGAPFLVTFANVNVSTVAGDLLSLRFKLTATAGSPGFAAYVILGWKSN
jgi:hypothetical protein